MAFCGDQKESLYNGWLASRSMEREQRAKGTVSHAATEIEVEGKTVCQKGGRMKG